MSLSPISDSPDSSVPAGCHFTGSKQVLGVSHATALRILEQAGMPLDSEDTITLPPETMNLLQKKSA